MVRLLTVFTAATLSLHLLQAQVLQPYWHTLTQADGLNQGQNAFLYKDRQGFLWISTTEGVNRYDSREVLSYKYKPGDPGSLQDGLVTGPFFEDKKGDIWFSTNSNISCYRRAADRFESFRLLSAKGDTIREAYFLFYIDKKERLWISADGVLHLFDPVARRDSLAGPVEGNRLTVQENAEGKPLRLFSPYKIYENGLDLYEFTAQGLQKRTFLNDTKTWYVLPESDTLVWVGADKGLVAFNSVSRREQTYNSWGDSTLRAHDVVAWGGRHLLVSSPDLGILVFDKIQRQFTGQFAAQPGRKGRLRQNNVRELYLDRDNVLWASLWPVGLDFTDLDKARFPLILDSQTPQRPDNTLGIIEDRLHQVWISTTGGLYLFDAQRQQRRFWNYGELTGMPSNREGRLALDPEGNVWLLTLNHILRFDPARLSYTTAATAEKNRQYLKKISFLPGRDTAIFHFGEGILRKTRDGKLTLNPAFDALKNNDVYYLCQTATGHLLAAVDRNALLVLQREGPQWQIRDTFYFPGLAMDFWPDPADKAVTWLSTTQGLARLDVAQRTLTFLNEKDGIPANVYYQLFYHHHRWWLTGNNGITVFDPERKSHRLYDLTDGLQSNEFNGAAAMQDSRGWFWMGGPLGVSLFHPDSVAGMKQHPPCRLVRYWVNDVLQNVGGMPDILRFDTRSVSLAFELHVLDFSRPGTHRLRYQLVGYENVPVEAADNAPIRYPNLPAGHYTLRVEGTNADGEWTGEFLEIPIRVSPPFYERNWFFWLLGMLAVVLAGFAWYRYRMAQIRRRAVFDQRLAEIETRALRTQLDHHFVFNAINAIKKFVVKADVDNAELYLNRFANLMRLILHNTQKTEVTLQSELELLENYIRIEQLRFGHKFDYQIAVAEDVAQESLQIPSLVLQPYVENAIVHGLNNKRDGKGLLQIGCSVQDEQLCIRMEDNGVGREKAAEIKAKSSPHAHHSVGMEVTRQQIEAFAKSVGGTASVEVTDLKNADGSAAGTRIDIRLPYSE
jgi:ligand-binding sensor domain-containing protein/anti-sigma regulatory factor (Ser/Thr protein kinase)